MELKCFPCLPSQTHYRDIMKPFSLWVKIINKEQSQLHITPEGRTWGYRTCPERVVNCPLISSSVAGYHFTASSLRVALCVSVVAPTMIPFPSSKVGLLEGCGQKSRSLAHSSPSQNQRHVYLSSFSRSYCNEWTLYLLFLHFLRFFFKVLAMFQTTETTEYVTSR